MLTKEMNNERTQKGIKLPLYAAILGLVVLALIIIVVVFHNLSSDRSPK